MLVAAAGLLMPALSLGFGITWDEWMQGHYGRLVLRYLFSGGTNRDFMDFAETTYLYGGLFDSITGFIYAVLFDSLPHFLASDFRDTIRGVSVQDLHGSGFYEIRHIVNAVFGWAGIALTGLLARRIGSWRAGCLAVLFLMFSPRYMAHSMNNPKDLPFATGYILFFCSLVCFVQAWPKFKKLPAAGMAAGIAIALGVRAAGLLLIFYLAAFTGLVWILTPRETRLAIHRLTLWLGIMALAGYAAGLLFWPYGLQNPVLNPFRAFFAFSNFSGAENAIFFEGQFISNAELPWYYLLRWFLISIPLFVLAALPFLFALPALARFYSLRLLLIPLGAFLFPLTLALIKKPILYDAWRHMLFLYPPLVALAALIWNWGISCFPFASRFRPYAAAVLLIAFSFHPVAWMVRNYPHWSVYFNPAAGGIRQAWTSYQTDYWGNSIRGCSEWLADYIRDQKLPHSQRPYLVFAEGNLMSSFPYLSRKLGNFYIPYQQIPDEFRKGRQPDFAILISKNLSLPQLLKAWPPSGTLYKETADGVTLCAVVENPNPFKGSPS